MHYTLTVTKAQAQTLKVACEVLARLGLGQFRDALDHLPTIEHRPEGWHEDMDAIGYILSKYTHGHVDGRQANLGIHNPKTREGTKQAWDLYQVIRHRLSWDAAIARGDIQPGQPRDWHKMMGVNFDEPTQIGKQPLARMRSEE